MYVHVFARWSGFQMHSKLHLITPHPPSSAYESQPQNAWLGPFSQFSTSWRSPPPSDVGPPRRGFPRPKFHSQVLTSCMYWYVLVYRQSPPPGPSSPCFWLATQPLQSHTCSACTRFQDFPLAVQTRQLRLAGVAATCTR